MNELVEIASGPLRIGALAVPRELSGDVLHRQFGSVPNLEEPQRYLITCQTVLQPDPGIAGTDQPDGRSSRIVHAVKLFDGYESSSRDRGPVRWAKRIDLSN